MVTSAIDFRFLLIENYKKMGITDTELSMIFVIDHLLDLGNKMITADILSLKMPMPVDEIDKCLASLLKKKIIDYVTKNKKMVTTLDPLKKRLLKDLQISMNEDAKNKDNVEFEKIYESFEKLLVRQLSPVEKSKINEWISYGYKEEMIIDALKEAINKNKKTLRSIDKILLEWGKREDIENEGRTFRDETWNKSFEETIKIAETPWIKDDKD